MELNPYNELVRMLENKLSRQTTALKETNGQLEGARKAKDAFDQAQIAEYKRTTPKVG